MKLKKKFVIYSWPASATKDNNPYNYLIYNNIEKSGNSVCEFDLEIKLLLKLIISSQYQILHLHWPRRDLLTSNSRIKSWGRIITFYFFIKIIKFFNKKIVWTVHNLEAHENRFPDLQKLITKILYSNVNGFITMNQMGLELIRKNVKFINQQKIAYIPHPHFKNYYSNQVNREEARRKLKIPSEKFVFLFLGLIKPYKNVPALIDSFNALKAKNKLLLIAGKVSHELQYLNEILEGTPDINFYNSFIKDDDLQVFFNAADVVVTPYTKVFNSGSAFLNLSFNKPTLAPEIGAFTELKLNFGSHWIKTYNGNLTADILEKTMKEVIEENNELSKPNLEAFDPETIAAKTVEFYKSLVSSK